MADYNDRSRRRRYYNRGQNDQYNAQNHNKGDWDRGPYDSQSGDDDSEYYDTPVTWTYTEYWLVPGPYVGMGPRGYNRSDEDICETVCERLAANGQVDARDIDVNVQDHEVTLIGTVDNRRTKRLAEDIAESVFGVTDVHNQLHIQKQGQLQQGQTQHIPVRQGQTQLSQSRQGQTQTGQTQTQSRTYPTQPDLLRDGQQVVGAKGKPLGYVKEIHAYDFVLGRPSGADVHIPFSAIQDITNERTMLNVTSDQVDHQNWSHIGV